jgi:hypothetical protein
MLRLDLLQMIEHVDGLQIGLHHENGVEEGILLGATNRFGLIE